MTQGMEPRSIEDQQHTSESSDDDEDDEDDIASRIYSIANKKRKVANLTKKAEAPEVVPDRPVLDDDYLQWKHDVLANVPNGDCNAAAAEIVSNLPRGIAKVEDIML